MRGDIIKATEPPVTALSLSHFLLQDLRLKPPNQDENSGSGTNDNAKHNGAGNGGKTVMCHSVVTGLSHVPKISADWALALRVLPFAMDADAVVVAEDTVTR